ncbi:hypothetical protein L3X38_037180 [Prunus dulcis]|uniref:Uncharacterized protein n=1 Tax=Prunus dulcis TaxID=3755 RepID=A0AAD4V418_PRUDU|nr:hypothetical protein L3X38_037180 [Prunus dulcis]
MFSLCKHLFTFVQGVGPKYKGEGEFPSLVVFRCGTLLALLRVVTYGNASLAKGDMAKQENAEGKGDAEGDTKIACRKAMRVPKVTQDVARHEGAEGDIKLPCRKAM